IKTNKESSMAARRGRRAPLWSTAEVLDLISILGESAVQAQLRSSRRNFDTYGIISRAMSERGYDRDTVQCRSKVKELRITYHRAKEANRRSGSAPATCRYYEEIEAILSGDPTTTAKSPVDTSAPPHPVNARPEQDEDVNNEKEEEMEDDLEESATACSQELFCTPAETSTQDMNCSVSSETAEGGSGKFLFRAAMAPAKISLSGVGVLAVSVPTVHTLYCAFIRSASTQAVIVKKSSVFRSLKVSSMYLQTDRMRNIRRRARRNREDMFQDLLKTAQESARENRARREESQQRRQKHRDELISVMKEQTELLKSMIALQTQVINVRAPLQTVQPCLPPTSRSPSKNFFEGHPSPWYTATSSPPPPELLFRDPQLHPPVNPPLGFNKNSDK
uniref:Myb/SANT-like DNA-binding domain-containing protein n=1 Tax=Pelusios castaneus TaxID=367368 RepID=A0A8C8S9K6_9SAUR